jgi:hypothetical protein
MDELMRRVRSRWTSGELFDGIDASRHLTTSNNAFENEPSWKLGAACETSFQKSPGT